jgi:PAS domain S-box-containing protein
LPESQSAIASLPSVRRYLLTRIVGIVVFSFILFGFATWLIVLRPAQDELARVEMDRAASQVESQIRSLIEQIERVLATSRDWGRQGLARVDRPQDIAALTIPVMRSRPQISQVLLANARGQAIHFIAERGGWLLREIDPDQLGRRQHWIHLNAEGGYLREEWVEQDAYDPRTRPWFQGALRLKEDDGIHWTDPYMFFGSKEPGITAAMRWTDRNSGEQMVVAMDVRLLDLSRYTGKVTVGVQGRAAILSSDGRLLGLPRHPQIVTDDDIKQRVLKTPAEAGLLVHAGAYQQWLSEGAPAAKASQFAVDGEAWLGRYRAIPVRNQQLLIGTVAPRSDFTLGSLWDAAAIAAMMVLVLVLAFLVGRRFSLRFAAVVDGLVAESQRIGKLDLDAPVQVRAGSRELAQLVDAQEHMRLMLIDATRGLEDKVRERTRELAERETELRAVTDEQKMLIENVQIGILFTGDGRILRGNPRLAEIFGYPDPAALVGADSRVLFPDDDEYRRFGAAAAPVLAAGNTLDIEWTGVRQDGTRFLGHTVARAIQVPGYRSATIWMIEDVTQRREAERRVTEARTQLQAIMDGTPSLIFMKDLEGRYLRVNRPFANFFGRRIEDIIGRTDHDLFALEVADRFVAADRAVFDSGRPVHLEERAPDQDGRPRDFQTDKFPLLDEDGRVYALAGVGVDITERKQAEKALKESLERQNAIFAASPYGIAVFQNRQCLASSPSFERTFGYAPGEFVGKSARVLFRTDADFETVGASVYEATSRGEAHSYEVELRRKDGSDFWCRVTAAPLAGQQGQRGIVALYEDISPRKRAEDALRAAHGEMDAILESASVGIALTRAGKVVRCNPRAEELFGCGKGELIGTTVQALFATTGENTVPEALARLARGETHRREKVLTRKDGSTFWCRFAGRAVDTADAGKGNVWMLEDISEEHAAAQALREAKQIAEDATQAKSMFLANMSHEIRTPMNAIIGMSHLALKTDLNPRQRDYVSKVHNAGTSLLGIINDILDFSKVEAGKLDIESVPFRLDDVLDNVSSLNSQRAYDKGLELLFDTAADVPQALVGDPLRLGQVITNLVSNAVKFTEKGQIAISVRRVESAGDKVQLRIEVRDTGIGMTREQAARLFQAFTQADGSTTRKYGGTGLGLTISKRLVEMMGGQFQVDSEPGRGSAFSFTSWFGLGDEAASRRRLLPDSLNGMRVLVADDNASAREILGEMLRGLNFSVSSVDSGAAAVQAVRAAATDHPFATVFMDWKMPGMDGMQAAREIRALPSPPHVLMVTAFGREDVRAQAEQAGIGAFLVKPVSQSSLVDALVGLFAPGAGVEARSAGRAAELRFDGVHLLLAEDNEINQQIALELLEGAGARLTIANNGREAVEKLAAGNPGDYDAVLMDLQMPEMGGIEATQRIRADARYAQLPIIAMTAHAMVEERERCIAAGMVDHITKPIDPQAMFQTLARWVKATRAASETPRTAGADALPLVDGLDTAGGLKRVAGNRKLYLSLLRQFIDNQADAAARVAAALARDDHAEAERIAHSVKGVAGNIGLGAVQAAAAALETAAREKKGLKGPASKMEAELARAVAALRDALPAESAATAAAAAADPATLARLAALLADGDGETPDFVAANAAALRGLFDGQFGAFERAVNDFDFETALDALRRAATARGIDLQREAS